MRPVLTLGDRSGTPEAVHDCIADVCVGASDIGGFPLTSLPPAVSNRGREFCSYVPLELVWLSGLEGFWLGRVFEPFERLELVWPVAAMNLGLG